MAGQGNIGTGHVRENQSREEASQLPTCLVPCGARKGRATGATAVICELEDIGGLR